MAVLKTISATVQPDAPIETPLKMVPSAKAKIAGGNLSKPPVLLSDRPAKVVFKPAIVLLSAVALVITGLLSSIPDETVLAETPKVEPSNILSVAFSEVRPAVLPANSLDSTITPVLKICKQTLEL